MLGTVARAGVATTTALVVLAVRRSGWLQLQAPIFEDKVVDHMFEQVKTSEKEVSKEDLEKAVEALEDDI